MLKLNVYGKSYLLPSKIEELTIAHYKKAIEPEYDEFDFLSNLGNIPKEELERVPAKEVKYFVYTLSNMLVDVKEFIAKDHQAPKTIEASGIKYIVPKDIGKESYGQYVSMEKITKDFIENNLGTYLNHLLAIYCLKKGEIFADIDFNKRLKDFEDTKFVDAYKVHCFFLLKSQEYRQCLSLALEQSRQQKKQEQEAQSSQKDGETT